jgi:hypothetical protein
MTISGLGLFSFGFGPLGFGVEDLEELTEPGEGVRYLDPATKDYAVDSDGLPLLGTPERQRVIVLFTTALRSSLAVRGVAMPEHHDATTERFMRSEIRTVLAPAVDDGSITIESIDVAIEADRIPGRLGVGVSFFNNRTGELEPRVDA